jgi:hypothetical protein
VLRGSFLCRAVRFEVEEVSGPFELCHCSRCRRSTGSAFMAGLWVKRAAFRLLKGEGLIAVYDAPVLESPPAYRRSFCRNCGSPLPDVAGDFVWLEIPAGLLEDDPGIRPDKHLVIGATAAWHEISDELPQMDRDELTRYRIDLWFRK